MSILIAIIGASGAGKSYYATQVSEYYKNIGTPNKVLIISEDSYFKGEKTADGNIDKPSAVDHKLLEKHLRKLKDGHPIEQPIYDHRTLSRKVQTITTYPSEIIIVEGLFLLANPELFKLFDLGVYIHVPKDLALINRLTRDDRDRGVSMPDTVGYYPNVRAGFLNYVRPYKGQVDLVINNLEKTDRDKNVNLLVTLIDTKLKRLASENLAPHQPQRAKL